MRPATLKFRGAVLYQVTVVLKLCHGSAHYDPLQM
mgnify:CR=1 FL=1